MASTVTVVVLLFGYHTSTDKTSVGTPTATASSPATTSAPSPSASTNTAAAPTTSSPTPSTTPSGSGKTTTYTGPVEQTRWGPVQVRITVTRDTVTDVTVLQQPDGNPRDVEINDRALPILISETKAASSADIDMVSGATVTSEGYLASLQAAFDNAGI